MSQPGAGGIWPRCRSISLAGQARRIRERRLSCHPVGSAPLARSTRSHAREPPYGAGFASGLHRFVR